MLFECHITVSVKDARAAEEVAKIRHWKTSEIARDPVLGKDTYFYLTKHSDEMPTILGGMYECSAALERSGVKVIREKIEAILLDVRH